MSYDPERGSLPPRPEQPTDQRKGILCPKCGRLICGKVPPDLRDKQQALHNRGTKGFTEYTRNHRRGIARVRLCIACGHRVLTLETIISNNA